MISMKNDQLSSVYLPPLRPPARRAHPSWPVGEGGEELPPLPPPRPPAVRDHISETKKFAHREEQRFTNCEEQPAQKNYCTFLSISWILVVAITTQCGPIKIIFSQLPKEFLCKHTQQFSEQLDSLLIPQKGKKVALFSCSSQFANY